MGKLEKDKAVVQVGCWWSHSLECLQATVGVRLRRGCQAEAR